MNGFMIAAPSSGSGKTTITLGLLRALRRMDVALAPVKAGPDYIDPGYHKAASGAVCFNLDPWGMRAELISALSSRMTEGGKLLVAEGMMGLFDGANSNGGSSADLARMLDLPVVLVVDCARLSHSVAAIVSGFSAFRKNVLIAGVILNRVGGARHEAMLREALLPLGIPVLGALPHDDALLLPERHLGLVQAGEHSDLERFLDHAADMMEAHIDFRILRHIWLGSKRPAAMANVPRLAPLGNRIAVARDDAFAFAYAHVFEAWHRRGAEISFFSPLADEGPAPDADAVYLPGGYPEAFAGKLAQLHRFREGMNGAVSRGAMVYGEGGGYIVLGEGLQDAEGLRHEMLGLLPLETSFAKRKLHLGYRIVEPLEGAPWKMPLSAHEFHYTSIVLEGAAQRLFSVNNAQGEKLGEAGQRVGSVSGSFMHIIDLRGDNM
ncbi:cobyrinic acid a,c-diamide synthase [Falsochrobactrum shanghaiense]|uniref:Hydrogenobyrinate a,c-diamide synthase n=1 Tax=Falsochrobactrum shanghaiense TaxID=2201899 RepID=A0A316JR54_9HYPH|nr:cobyrinate a,c-diamide synthase [Falsochrobactrum shanghaiense]PWL17700.1 cobyrinic acid a,c-diamide synthase [Falsochrobactrum shanghaiense]